MRQIIAFAIVAIGLSGCINAEEERQLALAQATARCDSQGKQLHIVSVAQHGIANVTRFHTEVDFKCEGPGDPDYVAPPSVVK